MLKFIEKVNPGALGLSLLIFLVAILAYFLVRDGRINVRHALLSGNYYNAFQVLHEAAQKNDGTAQNTVGNLYYLGLGVEQDFRRAAEWYLKAALNRDSDAMINMAMLQKNGQGGLKRDPLKAFSWFRFAKLAGVQSADRYLKYLIGGNILTPNMIQKAKKLYGNVEDLAGIEPG